MIAQIANRGTSFKGAGQYYLHDKKADTSERVAWTETRNLMTDNPAMGLRVMAATAMDKDRLKADAGIKATGRKSKGDVYSYSLAWHPDEQGKFNKDEMLQAANDSLDALGAKDHQAVIVAHQDEKHPHLHVIVNIVNPENGKNLNLSNDRKKLHKWSNDWRKERGEDYKYTPNKAKKYDAIEDKKRGMKVPYMNEGKSTPRQLNEAFETAKKTTTPTKAQAIKKEEAAKDKALSDYGRKLNNRQSNEWAALSDNYDLRKKNISKEYFKQKEIARAEIKEQMKPEFAALFKQQWKDKEQGKKLSGKFVQLFTKPAKKHNLRLKNLRAEENKQIKAAVKSLNKIRSNRYAGARQDFKLERMGLIAKQNAEKLDLKNRWSVRNDERKRVIDELKQGKKVTESDSKLINDSDRAFAKAILRERKEAKEKQRRTGRSRTRTRTRTRD